MKQQISKYSIIEMAILILLVWGLVYIASVSLEVNNRIADTLVQIELNTREIIVEVIIE